MWRAWIFHLTLFFNARKFSTRVSCFQVRLTFQLCVAYISTHLRFQHAWSFDVRWLLPYVSCQYSYRSDVHDFYTREYWSNWTISCFKQAYIFQLTSVYQRSWAFNASELFLGLFYRSSLMLRMLRRTLDYNARKVSAHVKLRCTLITF